MYAGASTSSRTHDNTDSGGAYRLGRLDPKALCSLELLRALFLRQLCTVTQVSDGVTLHTSVCIWDSLRSKEGGRTRARSDLEALCTLLLSPHARAHERTQERQTQGAPQ